MKKALSTAVDFLERFRKVAHEARVVAGGNRGKAKTLQRGGIQWGKRKRKYVKQQSERQKGREKSKYREEFYH